MRRRAWPWTRVTLGFSAKQPSPQTVRGDDRAHANKGAGTDAWPGRHAVNAPEVEPPQVKGRISRRHRVTQNLKMAQVRYQCAQVVQDGRVVSVPDKLSGVASGLRYAQPFRITDHLARKLHSRAQQD